MNKKVSKTLAAVLSAAMAASAFAMSTGATFAADNANSSTVNVSVSPASVGITAASAITWTGIDLNNYLNQIEGSTAFTVNGHTYTGADLTLTSGKWTVKDGNGQSLLDLNALDANVLRASTQAFSAQSIRTVTIQHDASLKSTAVGNSATGKDGIEAKNVVVEIDVTIYPMNSYIVLPQKDYGAGETPTSDVTLSMNEECTFDTYQIGYGQHGLATFTPIRNDYDYEALDASGKESSLISIASNGRDQGTVQKQDYQNPREATAKVVAKAFWSRKDVIPASVTVNDTYKVQDDKSDDFRAEGSRTISDDLYDVTGKDIIIGTGTVSDGNVTIGPDAQVGDITGGSYRQKIVVNGTTGNITAKSAEVDVQDDNGKVGQTIKTGNITASNVKVTGTTRVSNMTKNYVGIETGNITATNIGITTSDNENGNRPQGYGHVKVGNIVILRNAQARGMSGLTLTAGKYVNTMEVGKISGETGPYADSPFGAQMTVAQGTFKNLGDLANVGKITIGTGSTTADVTVGKIDTGMRGYDYYNGLDKTITDSSVQVNSGSKLTADKITTDHVREPQGNLGNSSITVPVNSLVINDVQGQQKSINTILYVTNAKPGDIVYTTHNGAGDSIFAGAASKIVAQAAGNNTYNFVMQSVGFDGIRMVNKAVEVGEDPVTLRLAALPDTASLPQGVTVQWTASTDTAGKQTVKLTPSADGMSCRVEATGYSDSNINGGNDVIVTATLMKDGKAYTGVAQSKDTASVTLTNKTADRPLTGISLDKTSAVMKPKATRQLTVSYAPTDTNADKTVTWTSSDTKVATVDNNGLVTGVAYGKATITAKVGDFTATCPVVVSTSGMVVKVTDLDGKVTECAPDGSTVMDVPQSAAYRVELTSDAPISEFSYNAGNGKVGGTNTISVWNGTAGTYEAYAAGKVGEQTGFYVNGDKLFDLQVVARPFTSDTTLTANVPVGKTYTFRITPNDKNAKFTFSTANGAALATSYKKAEYPDANGDYYCTVKTLQAVGNVGVYCNIDGKNYKVFAVNTRA